jgi:hypothetical protein
MSNKLIIDGFEYDREDFTQEQALLDERIIHLVQKRANMQQELDEMSIVIDVLIDRLYNILNNQDTEELNDQDVEHVNMVYTTTK